MAIRRFVIPVTVDAYGDAEEFTPVLRGKLVSISYVKADSNDFDEYANFTITSETSGQTLWAESDVGGASVTRHSRVPTHATTGAAANYDASNHAVLDKIALSQ